MNFKRYLLEDSGHEIHFTKPHNHLSHVEDAFINDGHDGIHQAANFLKDTHDMLSGKKHDCHHTIKFDGSPSIVFGHHPHNGAFFVATKGGAFGRKQQKVSFSTDDIINHHGHNPELATKLLSAHEHLHKIMPKHGGVYQGDIMHTPKDIHATPDGHIHFNPNTLTYSTHHTSAEGGKAINSHIGIVLHTMYDHDGVAHPIDHHTRKSFLDHPDVHNIDPTFKGNPEHYKPEDMNEFIKHRDLATKCYKGMHHDALDCIQMHKDNVHRYINHEVKGGGHPSAEGFANHLNDKHSERMSTITSDKWRKHRIGEHEATLNHVLAHSKNFEKAFELHGRLSDAKNVLVRTMAKSNPWFHSVNGEHSDPEGIVAVAPNGSAMKYVDRGGFSRHNFNNPKNKKDEKI